MGLIGWIKKEIESTSRQRRQSAPPPINHNLTLQDAAYRRAIEKFREYRNSGRFERLNETKNSSAITQSDITPSNNRTADEIYITDVEILPHERDRLIKNHRRNQSAQKHDQKTDAIYSNCSPVEVNNKSKRLSLPIIRVNSDTSTNNKSNNSNHERSTRKGCKKVQPTCTIDEIEEFEQNHCQRLDDISIGDQMSTPPSKFYRNNSVPFDGSAKKQTEQVPTNNNNNNNKKPTPKRLMGKNMLRRNKGKAPQPPNQKQQVQEESESTVNFYNGNFKRYDLSTASVDDELVISSRAYKGRLREERLEKINSVGESASSGSLSSENDKNLIKNRRHSPLNYQTVINKHGEEVEYALPYNERDSQLDLPPLPVAPMPNSTQISAQFEQLIDQNFKFLNSKVDFLNSQIDYGQDAIQQVDYHQRQNIQVTDLDKSNEAGLAFPMQTGDIMKDLDALAKWSQNYEKNDNINESMSKQYQAVEKGVKIFNACDIKYKAGSLRNSFSTPLEFSNGYFHQTPITLRSTLPNNYSISNFADIGCKREFEILCQIKHMSIVTLMGICFDKELRVTSLIMEPFDYTLNHYLHQMDKFYNIQQTVSVIHQIASATQYLNECGFIHSNISSHAVLIRENPFAVKLSSFELVTEILPRETIGKFYEIQKLVGSVDILSHDSTNDHLMSDKYGKLSKQPFYNRTSLPISKFDDDLQDNDDYKLPYSIPYRRMYSMHYYQAPELLVPTCHTTAKYVKPTVKSDVYGLGLLLWELINRVVPYVIYNHDELIKGLIKGNVQLPVLDKSSIIFKEIFESCLQVDSNNRLTSVSTFIKMLEDLQLLGYEKDKKIEVLEIIEPRQDSVKKTEKNIKNSDQRDKLREKIYFSKAEIDPQKRFENALTTENLIGMGIKDTSKISESIQSSEMEPQLALSFNQQPGILHDDALDRIRKTVESQRDITPKKPMRRRDDEQLEISKNSTMFQSFFGFDKLTTPKVDKDVIYERTSTLKKRMKASTGQKKSVKGLFDDKPGVSVSKSDDFVVMKHNFEVDNPQLNEDTAEKKMLREQFEKMNDELKLIVNNYNKSDFMEEIVQEIRERERAKKQNDVLVSEKLSSFLNVGMQDNANLSKSFEELPVNDKEDGFLEIKRSESGSVLNRYSSHESFSLPHTPIARQNMIRRNAWLSENNNRAPSSTHVSDEIVRRSLNFTKNSPKSSQQQPQQNLKQYNVNIKIHHNDLETPNTTPKSTNLNQSQSSVKIKLYNSSSKINPIVKFNNVDMNKTSYTEDINKKYYPLMPEMLSDAIQNKRDRSIVLQTTSTHFEDEHNKINNEKKLQNAQPVDAEACEVSHENNNNSSDEIEERVIVPVPMSVKDTVKFIETTYNPKTDGPKLQALPNDATKMLKITEETQTDEIDFPLPVKDDGTECLMQVSESIQKLESIHSTAPVDVPKKKVFESQSSSTSTQTPKKITTKVTLNLKKITGRSSDVSHLKRVQEQVRNNPEILKQFHAHLKESSLAACKNEISASCSSLVTKDANDEVISSKAAHKYFCRNCGFTMIPAGVLQKIRNSGRLSIASSVADSLQSIKYDESLQSLAAIRKIQQSTETRSTEDLYIDDDFCQGISQSLAANMELLSPPDFFDTLDFNILSAEIFHTQEHEFDYTLTGCNDELKQIEGKGMDDDEGEMNVSQNEEQKHVVVVPICDENEEIKKQDEPKV